MNSLTIRRSAAVLFAAAIAGSSFAKTPSLQDFAQMPLSFEANQGQADSQVKFLARGMGYNVLLTKQEAVLVLGSTDGEAVNVLRMGLAGANAAAAVNGLDPMAGRSNYIIGNDRSKWHTGVPNFGRVQYQGVYPGIDLVYYGRQGQLEYDFVAAPGADPSDIRLRFAGAAHVRIAEDGDLVLRAGTEELRFRKPVVYQTAPDGKRTDRTGSFTLQAGNQIGFQVGEYDHALPLVIDPVIVRSTYLGGKGNDIGYSIAVDQQGLVYVTGSTTSTVGFPLVSCFQCALSGPMDAFVTVFQPGGAGFFYSTYLGGSGSDIGYGIATDNRQNAYITGQTNSIDFPLAGPALPYGGGIDAFVTALNPAGVPIYSTYLGGKLTDSGHGIAVDSQGDAYVTGTTNSVNFPVAICYQCTHQGAQDAFVASFTPVGALRFSTYLGGKLNDNGYGISVDANNEIGVTGSTASTNFPAIACAQCANAGGTDAFATALIFTGTSLYVKWSTYWGGSADEAGYGIVMDSVGQAWMTGYTTSTDFPVTATCVQCVNGGGQDAIVVRFKITTAAFSDYLGGVGTDTGRGIAEMPNNASGGPLTAYLTGDTTSPNFPLVNCIAGFGCALNGLDDAFVGEYTLGGGPIRVYTTYLGGKKNDVGRGIALGQQSVFVTGSTAGAGFPILGTCTQCAYTGGATDAFVTVIQ